MHKSMFVLWLEGVNPEVLSSIPALSKLAADGVDLQLSPSPLVEKSVCYYQTLTGMESGKLGRFDAVYPLGYKACKDTTIPDGASGRLLTDLLRRRKLDVTFVEAKTSQDLLSLGNKTNGCLILRLLDLEGTDTDRIEALINTCLDLAPPDSHMIILTDVWSQAPLRLVNTNDFLADVGLLEVGAPRNRDAIIWPESLAYGLGAGQVWINLRGREEQGVVEYGTEYEQVSDALIKMLQTKWLDPVTNDPVVEHVLRREQAFNGQYLFKAPDLVIVFRPGYGPSPKARDLDFDGYGVQEVDTPAKAIAPYARLIANSRSLLSGVKETAALVDVVPSLLSLLGEPVPDYVDGKVISSIFTLSHRQQHPVRYMENDDELLSDEDEGTIVARLKDLGYL